MGVPSHHICTPGSYRTCTPGECLIILYSIVTSKKTWWLLSCWHFLSLALFSSSSAEASCPVVNCPVERLMWQKLSIASVPQPASMWILPTARWVSLKEDSFPPFWASQWSPDHTLTIVSWEMLSQRTHVSHTPISTCCYFKLLSLGWRGWGQFLTRQCITTTRSLNRSNVIRTMYVWPLFGLFPRSWVRKEWYHTQ